MASAEGNAALAVTAGLLELLAAKGVINAVDFDYIFKWAKEQAGPHPAALSIVERMHRDMRPE